MELTDPDNELWDWLVERGHVQPADKGVIAIRVCRTTGPVSINYDNDGGISRCPFCREEKMSCRCCK